MDQFDWIKIHKGRTAARKPYTASDVKLLKWHSKARTPVSKIAKQMKRCHRIPEAESVEASSERYWPSEMIAMRSKPVSVASKSHANRAGLRTEHWSVRKKMDNLG